MKMNAQGAKDSSEVHTSCFRNC